MRQQRRWFWGILLTAFLTTVVMGIFPWMTSSSLLGVQQTGDSRADALLSYSSAAVAQDTAPSPGQEFNDPSGQYKIALLDGYQVYKIANGSVIEASDGSLAYTVVVLPTFDPDVTLTGAALAQLARETFQQGEGFVTREFQPTSNGIKVNWQGRVTTRGSQTLSGSIFARQEGDQVFLLMIAATEAGQATLADAIASLPPSLQPLTP